MTPSEVRKITKALERAQKVALNARGVPMRLDLRLTEALREIGMVQAAELCPSCNNHLRAWHDHKPGCREA